MSSIILENELCWMNVTMAIVDVNFQKHNVLSTIFKMRLIQKPHSNQNNPCQIIISNYTEPHSRGIANVIYFFLRGYTISLKPKPILSALSGFNRTPICYGSFISELRCTQSQALGSGVSLIVVKLILLILTNFVNR